MTAPSISRADFEHNVHALPQRVVDVNRVGDYQAFDQLMAPFHNERAAYQRSREAKIRRAFWGFTFGFGGAAFLSLFTVSPDLIGFALILGNAALLVYMIVRLCMSASNARLLTRTEQQYASTLHYLKAEQHRRWQAAHQAWLDQQEREEQARREAHQAAVAAEQKRYSATRQSLALWQHSHPAPAPQPYGVSAQGAEAWICEWMTHMGAEGSRITQFSGDGGIDVEARDFIAQVKHYTKDLVPIAAIRAHIGVAALDPARRTPVFFTSSGYPPSAITAAESAVMALFTYRVETGIVEPRSLHARFLVKSGFERAWWPSE